MVCFVSHSRMLRKEFNLVSVFGMIAVTLYKKKTKHFDSEHVSNFSFLAW